MVILSRTKKKVVNLFLCFLIFYVISSLFSRQAMLRMSNSIHSLNTYAVTSIGRNKTYMDNPISRTPSSNKTDIANNLKNKNFTNITQDVSLTKKTPLVIVYSRPTLYVDSRPTVYVDSRPRVYVDSRPTVYVDSRPTVYVITPTYARPSQHPDLTRISQALMLAGGRIHWLIIEDSTNTTQWVKDLAERALPDSHSLLICDLEKKHDADYYKDITRKLHWAYNQTLTLRRGRGVPGRNCALQWLLENNITEGVFYFADDDNAYDARIFNEIRDTKKVALFPTGSFSGVGVSTPVVVQGKVVSFMDIYMSRRFSIDMAAFAISVSFWRERGAPMLINWAGLVETSFLQLLKVSWADFEPKADNATKIWTWHTKTKQELPNLSEVDKHIAKYPESNLPALKKWMQQYKKV